MREISILICFVINIIIRTRVQADVYTSISGMETLVETQRLTIKNFEKYIATETERIAILEEYITRYVEEYERAMKDTTEYLGNPISALILMKRQIVDLKKVEFIANNATEYKKYYKKRYPTHEDYLGALNGFARLQTTYLLNITQLANGILNSSYSETKENYIEFTLPMTASDCFELGRASYTYLDIDDNRNIAWLIEAFDRYETEKNIVSNVTLLDIVKFLSYSYYLVDDLKNVILWTKKLVELKPGDPRNTLHNMLIDQCRDRLYGRYSGPPPSKFQQIVQTPTTKRMMELVKARNALCRGEKNASIIIDSTLSCYYAYGPHPYLKLARIKAELLHRGPDIVMFHQIISDEEIRVLKEYSKSKLERSLVRMDSTGISSGYRISQTAFILSNGSEVIKKVSHRIGHFTGLNMDFVDFFQMTNYGIGGYYEAHYDFYENDTIAAKHGNRIATVTFYMSDVEQGGATVFSQLNLTIFPEKGAALFWWNLHPSGNGDYSTLHIGCPVLRGSKWILNKWITAVGQELNRPCNLEKEHEDVNSKVTAVKKMLGVN